MAKVSGFKIFKIVIKSLCLTVIFGVIAILLWRMFSSGDPASMKGLTANQPLYDAWQKAEAEGGSLTMYTQELDTITRTEHSYGYFSVTEGLFIEEADQVQVVFRYNNSTIRHLVEDKQLPVMPDRSEDLYDVTLVVAYDLTPDVTTDNAGNDPAAVRFERFHATSHTAAEKTVYNYRRLVFDGIPLQDPPAPILAVYVDIYYKGDVNYDETPYGTLIIYDYLAEREMHTLSSADRRALEDFAE